MEQKKKVTAALFAFLLGFLGIHDFYLGYKKKAVMHLVMYIITLCLILPCMIPYLGWAILILIHLPLCFGNAIWAVVEGVKILSNKDFVDANGNTLA